MVLIHHGHASPFGHNPGVVRTHQGAAVKAKHLLIGWLVVAGVLLVISLVLVNSLGS